MELKVGMEFTATTTVTPDKTAQAVGSGSLPVYATPMMVALMEEAATACIAPALEEGNTSVGTALSIAHNRATAVGGEVSATATVTAVDRRRVDFSVTARDAAGEIGGGTHSRFVVNAESFLEKISGAEQK